MVDNTQVKSSNRDRYEERLKAKYPDREFADDEALFGQINDDYDDYDRQLEEHKGYEKTLSDMFTKDDRSASFLTDWRNGEDPVVGLVRRFGDDFKAALEDPEKVDALAEANKEYSARIAKDKEYEEEYQKNIQETLNTIEAVQSEDGLTDDDIDKAMTFLIDIMRDGILGKFSAESIRMALNAVNYDADMAAAENEGEVRGRNAKIDEKLRKSRRTDGMANLAGKNGSATPNRQQPTDIFSVAEGAR